ncbi:MAG: hypothetical protein ABIF19_11375 [Planctomycetota bacterium]
MKSQNYLGIYISRDTATVVCIDSQGKDGNVAGCFTVAVEESEQASMQTLAGLIVRGCDERQLKFSEVAVALDCAMFMQHSVHSQFSDPKQIASTVKFDTEETLATDIADVALAFEIVSADEAGSELNVFTSQRKVLSDVLTALQEYNLDPVTIEPDVSCLSRFIRRKVKAAEPPEPEALFAILSRRTGYLIVPARPSGEEAHSAATVRTFLVGPTQDRSSLLTREVLVTTALLKGVNTAHSLKVFDSAGKVDFQQLGEKLGIETAELDWHEAAGTPPQKLADCANAVDFAIACGAALTHSQKGHCVNFRDDFSPFQGKKVRLQQALKFAAISVTVLLAAVGLYFHTQLYSANKDKNNLRARFARDYSAVMLDKLGDNVEMRNAVRHIGDMLRKLEKEKQGLIADEKSISSKLTLVLAAFNKCASKTGLNVKSITITNNDIIITGDTPSRQNTTTFFEELRSSGLEILRPNFELKGARDNFNIIVAPSK